MKCVFDAFRFFILLTSFTAVVRAQLKEGNAVEAKPRSPAEQLTLFTVPEGFSVELVASEQTGLPKPVMTAFDDSGRLWSVTATEYPRDNDPAIWQKPGRDRVVVFDNPLGMGPHEARVFADGLMMPLSVLPAGRGAYVAQGPEIIFLDDKDGDGKSDHKKTLMKGFGVQDTHTLPHQLTRMPGGRIVFSQGVLNDGKMVDASGTVFEFNKTLIASIKPDGTDSRIIGAGLNNIWSWAHSRRGRVFIHEANDLGYSIVPFEEDTSYPSFKVMRLHPSSPLHPPTAEGLNLGGTGFSGIAICDDTDGSYPRPWAGLTFVANPITGRINSVLAVLGDNGVWTFKKQPDLVACSDPMFRPIAITFGPDGCLYITDWYNRIISHNEVARDHPGRDKERGRVWRVRYKSQPPPRPLDMAKVPDNELPRHLTAANTWEMRAAWHQIASRKATALSPALVSIVGSAETADDARIHALWSLEELGYYDAELWKKLLANPSPDVRREAIRALSTLKVSEDEAFRLFQPLADEESWTVRYEILRFFRRAKGSVNQQHFTWLRRWSESPAPQNKVTGWGGQYLALGGSYERAFQDFLLRLAEVKTGAALVGESKWNKVIAILPTPTTEETALKAKRHAVVKAALPAAKAQEGKAVVQSLCLSCHSIAGKGAGFAPPLDGSESRDLDSLITAIISPNEAVENVFRLYRLEKIDGNVIEGFKRSEDAIDIVIMLLGGVENRIPIGQIKSAGYVQNHSMMPDVTAGMSELQVAAIVAFLRTVK